MWVSQALSLALPCPAFLSSSVFHLAAANRELMLALSRRTGDSGRSLTTIYETIPYLLHCRPGCSWLLNVVLRQQEGIDDDHHDVCAGHQEDDYDHKEVVDQEKGHGGFSISYSVTARVAVPGRAEHDILTRAPIPVVPGRSAN
jgi:hypothetical protein